MEDVNNNKVRLRQIALVAKDLNKTINQLCTTLDAPLVETDPGVGSFGLHNGLIQVGDCFIEVVAPLPEKSDPLNQTAGGRYINRFGDGGYMVLMQVPDLLKCEETLVSEYDFKPIHIGGRTFGNFKHPYPRTPQRTPGKDPVPNNAAISGTHFHPKDMGCIIEVTEQHPSEEWLWAGANWIKEFGQYGTSKFSGGLAGCTIAVNNPEEMCKRWEAGMSLKQNNNIVIGRRLTYDVVTDDGAIIKFRKPLNKIEDGVVAIDIFARDPKMVGTSTVVANVIFNFVAPPAIIDTPPASKM